MYQIYLGFIFYPSQVSLIQINVFEVHLSFIFFLLPPWLFDTCLTVV